LTQIKKMLIYTGSRDFQDARGMSLTELAATVYEDCINQTFFGEPSRHFELVYFEQGGEGKENRAILKLTQ